MSGRFGQLAIDEFSPQAREAAAEARRKKANGPAKPPERLGFKSNARNPMRMSHGAVQKYHGGEELKRPSKDENATERRRTSENVNQFNGKQGVGRPKHETPTHANGASDAAGGVGVEIRYDASEEKPWCVIEWPEGTEKSFATKMEAHEYILSLDDDEYWNPGKGATHERERVR